MHYNFDTHLSSERFRVQKGELQGYLESPIRVGRAHYLLFEHNDSFSMWSEEGIEVDESVGYPDYIGYRAGIAGAFSPWNPATERSHELTEIPLTLMDGPLFDLFGRGAVEEFDRQLSHLAAIGGLLSLLVHPGVFDNPEFPVARGLYRRILEIAKQRGAQSGDASTWVRSAQSAA